MLKRLRQLLRTKYDEIEEKQMRCKHHIIIIKTLCALDWIIDRYKSNSIHFLTFMLIKENKLFNWTIEAAEWICVEQLIAGCLLLSK